jgi:iron complex transport system substrate-binding protein
MVPSITEILFDIGIGDRIVGDSKYTTYPPETKEIEKIGGLFDAGWDKIVDLKPDLLLMLVGKELFVTQAQKAGIEILLVDHQSMEGLLASYDLIGERFGSDVMQVAQTKKAILKEKLEAIQSKAAKFDPVRVLLCIDREWKGDQLQNIYVVGTSPYFQDAIRWAGGINVAETTGLAFPYMSTDEIRAINPDVIIDLMVSERTARIETAAEISETEKNDFIDAWKTLGDTVNAVQTGRIHIITENYATVPGPRTPLFVEKLLEILHGEHTKQPSNNSDTLQETADTTDE